MNRLLFLAVSILIVSCQPKKAKDPEPAPTEIGDTSAQPLDTTAQNSLDYLGLYKGKFPCPDCRNSEVLLELAEDFSYVFSKYGNGKTDNKIERKGSFKWDAEGKGIILSGFGEAYDHFLVTDQSLVAVDEHNIKMHQYTLKKLPEAEAETTDEAPQDKKAPKLTGIHWKLTEINGKPVSIPQGNEYFIELKKDHTFSAFAGCNRMNGKYEITASKARLFQIVSTMMSCPHIEIENQMKAALESADNVVANEQVLQFRKGGTNLIKFEAATK
ncbi:META domain-containing protein [Flavobacterium silvaticum]|uniref:META domain-containing protein n=1 Tax=Flavobacterium silvaticum TaxID=1852020 RepID=A0A972FND7_9FLAO|nr:META domain-containing protein [Flavobacterium silvaticum]NMH29221.1 META domain-containing protein [Flavobacterium silvaticum]